MILDFNDFKQIISIMQMNTKDDERDTELYGLYNKYLSLSKEDRDKVNTNQEVKSTIRNLLRKMGSDVV